MVMSSLIKYLPIASGSSFDITVVAKVHIYTLTFLNFVWEILLTTLRIPGSRRMSNAACTSTHELGTRIMGQTNFVTRDHSSILQDIVFLSRVRG